MFSRGYITELLQESHDSFAPSFHTPNFPGWAPNPFTSWFGWSPGIPTHSTGLQEAPALLATASLSLFLDARQSMFLLCV